METKTYTVYKFKELSDKAQEKALEKLSDLNTSFDWWEYTYDDAKMVGLQITGFDIDRGAYCNGDFIEGALSCAEKILKEHGQDAETHTTAKAFKDAYFKAFETIGNFDESNEKESIIEDFKKSILEDYRLILKREYEYLTSREALIETIEANDYDFLENGTID